MTTIDLKDFAELLASINDSELAGTDSGTIKKSIVRRARVLYLDILGESVSGFNSVRWLGYANAPGLRHLATPGIPHTDIAIDDGRVVRACFTANTEDDDFVKLSVMLHYLEPNPSAPWKNRVKTTHRIELV